MLLLSCIALFTRSSSSLDAEHGDDRADQPDGLLRSVGLRGTARLLSRRRCCRWGRRRPGRAAAGWLLTGDVRVVRSISGGGAERRWAVAGGAGGSHDRHGAAIPAVRAMTPRRWRPCAPRAAGSGPSTSPRRCWGGDGGRHHLMVHRLAIESWVTRAGVCGAAAAVRRLRPGGAAGGSGVGAAACGSRGAWGSVQLLADQVGRPPGAGGHLLRADGGAVRHVAMCEIREHAGRLQFPSSSRGRDLHYEHSRGKLAGLETLPASPARDRREFRCDVDQPSSSGLKQACGSPVDRLAGDDDHAGLPRGSEAEALAKLRRGAIAVDREYSRRATSIWGRDADLLRAAAASLEVAA